MKKRLLFINQYYYPDLASTGQLMTQLCESLASDYDVTVLTAFPSYSVASQRPKKLMVREQRGGVSIIRVYSTTFSRHFMIFRMLNYLSYFFFSSLVVLWLKRPDIVVTQTDPPVIGFLGLIVKWFKRCPLCIVFQDVFPEVAVALGKLNPLLTSTLRCVRVLLLKYADRLVAISDGMKKQLIVRGASEDRVTVISNWIDTELVQPVPKENSFRQEHGLEDAFIVMHSGNIGLSQDFDIILKAAELLQNDSTRFLVVGDGATREWLADEVQRKRLSNVLLKPYQPLEKLRYSLGAADVHLVTLKAGLEGFIVPSKLYGIMGAERPVIGVVSNKSEVYDIIEKYQIGKNIEHGDADGLAKAILWFKSHPEECQQMSKRSRQAVCENYSRRLAAKKYQLLFEEMSPNETR